jgi:urocanate hydratase
MLRASFSKRFFTSGSISSSNARFQSLLKDLIQTVQFDSQNRITNIPESPVKLDDTLDHAPRRIHTLNDK